MLFFIKNIGLKMIVLAGSVQKNNTQTLISIKTVQCRSFSFVVYQTIEIRRINGVDLNCAALFLILSVSHIWISGLNCHQRDLTMKFNS